MWYWYYLIKGVCSCLRRLSTDLTSLSVCPAASPKLFLDSSSPCPTLSTMHSSLHSPLTRQLSTSSENSTPLGLGVQSTPVRKHFYFPVIWYELGHHEVSVFQFQNARNYQSAMTQPFWNTLLVKMWSFQMTEYDQVKECSLVSWTHCRHAILWGSE